MANTSFFKKIDCRYFWFVPLAMISHLLIGGVEYPQIAIASIAASVLTMLLLSSVNYSCFSSVTIYSLMAFVSYPVAVYANLLLESPAVRPDLWEETGFALSGYIIGVVFMYFGVKVHKFFSRNNEKHADDVCVVTSVRFNFAVASIVLFVVILKLKLGLYYHGSIVSFSGENNGYLNLLEHLSWLSYCGMFLQVYRYIATKSKKDLFFALILVSVPMLAFLPSGSREQAFGYMPLLILFYLYFEKSFKAQVTALSMALLIGVPLMIIVGIYRDIKGVADVSGAEKYAAFQIAASAAQSEKIDSKRIIVGRLSDFVATGRIIAKTPEEFPFSGFTGMEEWWQVFLPGFLRPSSSSLNFTEGAVETQRYRVSNGEWTSTPIMILGDLFRRFDWWGIVCGMFIFGYVLSAIDLILSSQKKVFFIVFGVLFFRFVWRLYVDSLLISFSAFTRDILLVYLVSKVLVYFANRRVKCSQHVLPVNT